MSVRVEIQSTVKGGFPVFVEASFIAYDDGLELDYLDLYNLKGKPAEWLNPGKADMARLETELREKIAADREAFAERMAALKEESKEFWSNY